MTEKQEEVRAEPCPYERGFYNALVIALGLCIGVPEAEQRLRQALANFKEATSPNQRGEK